MPPVSAAVEPTGPERPDAMARVEADAGAAPCVMPALQRGGRCAPPPGLVTRALVVRWFTDQGATDPSDLRKLDNIADEGCDEVVFGSSNERVLACVTVETVEVDPSLHAPIQIDTSLKVLAVRDRKLVELAFVPIGVASSESGELLFRAHYALKTETRSLDVVVDEEDCRAANGRLGAYWKEKITEVRGSVQDAQTKRILVHAHELERQTGASRIAAICRAAGHYVEVRGRLVKSKT